MSVINREDGIKFVIHTYREILLFQRSSRIKEEIRALARDHGEYVRFFKKNDEQIEAIFSKESGFLLAESVWYYFNRPNDLIYCEILPDQLHALLVIIQRDNVYLDTKLAIGCIKDEIASFMTGDNQYHVYVYGNAPISDGHEAGKFTISKDDLAAFTRLQESVFEKLSPDENLQLQPLNLVLRTQKFGKSSLLPLGVGAVILLLFVLGWWYFLAQTPAKIVTVQKPIEKPFANYKDTLSTAIPLSKLFEEFASLLAFSSSLPGWRVSNITYRSNIYMIDVKPQGQLSSLQVLEKWLKQYGLKFTFKKEGIQFVVNSIAQKRKNIPKIEGLNHVTMIVIDKLKRMLPIGSEIHLENANRKVDLTSGLEIKINFSSTSPDVLILLGRELLSFPVFVKEMSFSTDNNLLSGSLQLMVLGK